MLKNEANIILKQEESDRRNLINALFGDPAVAVGLPPELNTQNNCDPIVYNPEILQIPGITPEALAEQELAPTCCIRTVDHFLEPTCRGVKFPCLIGRPGSGKSCSEAGCRILMPKPWLNS